MHFHRPFRSAAILAFAALTAALSAQGTPIGFEETYALAPDRQKVVATLIPGSDDWYYYSCRERLDARDFDTVRKLLPTWIDRFGRNQRTYEIENREALLSFAEAPERTFTHLRSRLGLQWNHQRVVPGERSDLPTKLDPRVIDPTALTARAFAQHQHSVDGFTDRALAALLTLDLDEPQLRSLLSRLDRPDVANLPALVVRDLGTKTSRGFGSLPIHRELRQEQLEECARMRPQLLQDGNFVAAYLERLQPGADTVWQKDPAARAAQYARLWAFAQRLSPAFNSLKAHVLYHWLQHDLTQGAPDKARFLAYIQMPRRAAFVSERLRDHPRGEEFVDGRTKYPTALAAIGDDTALVRACLEYFFAREDGIEPYVDYLHADWLRRVLAETKILLGQGDMERWYTLLGDRSQLEQIEKRVEIMFPPTQRTRYAAGDAVTLDVDTKNVPTLLLKVFTIDSYRFHVERQKDVDATIELDGVVANAEQTFTYAEPPARRVRRSFDLPMLQAPGTYVVELVGNGISSRAVIHKGGLRAVERTCAAGHLFSVYDEAGVRQKDAMLWFGGREYTADAGGEILLPFTTEPGGKKVVLRHGNRSSLASFEHREESYALRANVHVDREALVAGQKASLVVRPQLRLAGRDVALSLLAEPVLTIFATDLDGTTTPKEVRGLQFADDREFVHDITVPERLQSLQVTLGGKVKDLAGKDVELESDAATFAINGIDPTPVTGSAMLVRTKNGYALEVRGKNGEPKVGQTLALQLSHRDYRDTVDVSLQTDAAGRIELGALPGIERLAVHQPGFHGVFSLSDVASRVPDRLHGRVGDVLRLPYLGKAASVSRAEFSLLGQQHDEFDHLALADGFVELRDLAPGDYRLRLHDTGDEVQVRITAGPRDADWLLGADRVLQATRLLPLHLRGIETGGGELVVRLANSGPGTRVHVAATRFQPSFDAFADLRGAAAPLADAFDTDAAESSYHAGRKLGDEYRYVLERRFQTKYAGNMLRRPSLLLTPWAVDDDSKNDAVGIGGGSGGRYGGRGGGRGGKAGGASKGEEGGGYADPGLFANLDYLPRGAGTVHNLVPDGDGVVRCKLADLGDGQLVQVVAIDGDQILRRSLVRDELPLQPRNRALSAAIDGRQHTIEQKRIEFVAAGGKAVLGDARAAQVEIYDSLATVHRLLTAVSHDESLAKFAFVLQWPKLTLAEKQALYSEHACHELHFFLYHKDRAFFDSVCKPFLADKHEKTFLDHWLLGDDLRSFTEPWAFAQRNLVEKILLARRLDGAERAAVARLVREALELRPVDRERLDELFDFALKSANLDEKKAETAVRLGFVAAPPPPAAAAPAPVQVPGAPRPGGGRGEGGPGSAGPGGPTTGGLPAKDRGREYRGPGDKVPASPEERRKQAGEPARTAEPGDEKADRDAGEAQVEFKESLAKNLAEDATRRGRAQAQALYRAVEPTKLLVEHDYWHRGVLQTTPDVVAPNHFWSDFAAADPGQPFVSSAVVETGGSFLEMMMALAVLDLPFEAGQHEVTADGDQRTLRAATPLLLVRKELQKTEKATDLPPLLLGENFFRLDDRYRFENGERRDAFVTEEFLAGVAYGCQVVVTNPTSQKRTTDLLLQIPAGAVPVQTSFWTKGLAVELQPYATASIEYAFYFPTTGEFAHYPVHAAEKGKLAAHAEPRTLKVVVQPTKVDTTSWEHVSQQGTAAEVMAFVDTHNVQRLDLSRVAWRLKDREFFAALLPKLRARHVYDDTLWSYSILHRDADAAREYLRHADGLLANCGMALQSPLLTIDPVERKQYQHLELDPLVHQRVHKLGSQRVIGNRDLARQYASLMTLLGYTPKLDSQDWLVVTYYLLLQDRIEEALAAFARIDGGSLTERIQYDYLATYLCFFTADAGKARSIAERYKDHPVPHWQKRFAEVLGQLDEAEGKAKPVAGEPTADSLAAQAPALELALEGKSLTVRYKNLAQCEVRYYALDVEFAFSAQPFASQGGATAAFVQPNLREAKDLPKGQGELRFEVPERFHQQNVLVEVRGGGLLRAQTFFANALATRFLETHGQVVVTEPGTTTPLPKTYVKVFAKLPSGEVRFHKDGYTDLRGRFDYASVSDDPNAGAVRYAVLVLHEQKGAVIREVAPPTK